jgi:hypothetical protein
MKIFALVRSESIGSENLLFEAGEKPDTGPKKLFLGLGQKLWSLQEMRGKAGG